MSLHVFVFESVKRIGFTADVRGRLLSMYFASQGFSGFNCGEFEGYSCANLRCQNGGTCQGSGGNPQCHCPPGFGGGRCEIVQNCPCHNGGLCVPDPQNRHQVTCRCPPPFQGRHCERLASLPTPSARPSCPYVQCEQTAGDGVCDPQCKNQECSWDGGDCSLHWPKPWENCTANVHCWDLFGNERCDPECDNAGCLFDNFECQGTSPSPSPCK